MDSEKVAKAGDTMTGPLIIPLGAVAATSLNFGGGGCGMWSTNANNVINFSTSSVLRLTIGGAGGTITSAIPYLGPTGTVTAPTYSFSGAATNGFWRSGTNQVSVATNGIEAMRWNADQSTTALGPVTLPANPTLNLQAATKQYVDAAPNQMITLSGDISGSGTAAITTTLATVNGNVGTWNNVTVNGKGQVTAGSNVAYVTGGPYLPTAGGSLTGALTVSAAGNQLNLNNPTTNQSATLNFQDGGLTRWAVYTSADANHDLGFYDNVAGRQVLTLGSSNNNAAVALHWQPSADNVYVLGGSGVRWGAVWAVNGAIQTSDARAKVEVEPSDLGLDFITALKPVSYRWEVGGNVESGVKEDGEPAYAPVPGKRRHYGLVAQEVKEVLGEKDFGGLAAGRRRCSTPVRSAGCPSSASPRCWPVTCSCPRS